MASTVCTLCTAPNTTLSAGADRCNGEAALYKEALVMNNIIYAVNLMGTIVAKDAVCMQDVVTFLSTVACTQDASRS